MPLTTMGKEPDLGPFSDLIAAAISAAIKKAQKAQPKRTGDSIKKIVFEHMAEAVEGAGGGYRAGERQVFYELRRNAEGPLAGRELRYGTFESYLTDYENEHGEISAIFRDNRGVLVQPFVSGPPLQVGTLMAEQYQRPAWKFNKLLFIEKEGFFEALRSIRWPETHDCAVLTTKGFATRAAKDLIDFLAEHDEPIKIFCAHDADSAGTMILQTLREATRARDARSIEIIDIGLNPWEARDMGLEPESFEKKDRERPVADYVKDREDGDYWTDWLQSNRYELNAMTMPQFLSWLTEKVTEHDIGKVIPPPMILDEEADRMLMERVRDTVTARVLREADIDGQVAAELEKIERPDLTPEGAKEWLADHPSDEWRGYVKEIVEETVENE